MEADLHGGSLAAGELSRLELAPGFFLSEYVGWSQTYICKEVREKMPKKFPVLLNTKTSKGFVAAETRIEAIEQPDRVQWWRDSQLERRNRL